jgi:uncharacterized Zn-binding protein involved in type VI secretion
MGMPAATITSLTAHGGTVVVGFPTVIINFMPASRIGDMHVCPMVTGVVPHVGGPFILGSMTVLTGFMPQSRVTDQLVCVGPPDICVMGAMTVLVGMAGAGGAGAAAAGIAAMGAAVPMNASSAPAGTPQSAMQYDGTVNTSTQASSLPPIPLTQKGWPDLSPENTATFQSVQPVTLPQGTQLFAAADSQSNAVPNFWSTVPPQITDPTKDAMKVLTVTDPAGMQAWAGQAASEAQHYASQGLQMVQQAAAQAQQEAQQQAQQIQQKVDQVKQQAQQQVQAAQAAVQQAQQQLNQATAEGKAAAQQALNQAQQQAQQVEQQAQQTVQQAEKQGQQAAQQAAQQAQQTVQQAQQQARQAAAQAQQAAGQATQQATQVCTSAESAGKQAIQNFAAPKLG